MVVFLDNLYIFVWICQGYLASMFFVFRFQQQCHKEVVVYICGPVIHWWTKKLLIRLRYVQSDMAFSVCLYLKQKGTSSQGPCHVKTCHQAYVESEGLGQPAHLQSHQDLPCQQTESLDTTDSPLYTDTRYDKICSNDNLTITKLLLKR